CDQCDLIYVAEELTRKQLTAYYGEGYYTGTQDKGYKDYIGQRESRKSYFRSTIPMIKRYLPVEKPRVLDVGCATGCFLEVSCELGWEPHGVELSAYAAQTARSLGLDVRTGTLAEAMLRTSTFDLVTFWDTIEHVPDPLETLTLTHDLLERDGLVVISTADISTVTARFYGKQWALLAPPGHLFYFSRKTLSAILRRTGFRPLNWQYDGAFLVNDVPDAVKGRQSSLLNS